MASNGQQSLAISEYRPIQSQKILVGGFSSGPKLLELPVWK